VDSNGVNKGQYKRGLTQKGIEQVSKSAAALNARGIVPIRVFYDNGARASQTAAIISEMMKISWRRIDPEFRFLEARAMGIFEGAELQEAKAKLREIDVDYTNTPPEAGFDGVESNSLNEVFCRMRNCIQGAEAKFSGEDVIIIGGDSTVLSVFAAAACGMDLSEHWRFELPPGGFFYLPELVRDVNAGNFQCSVLQPPTNESIAAGRAALREIGSSALFTTTHAGYWVMGENES